MPGDPRSPTICIRGARAAYIGPSFALAPHTNAVATVAIALEIPFQFAVAGSIYETHWVTLIPPGVEHHLVAVGPMVFLYLDAAEDDYAQLAQTTLVNRHSALVQHVVDEPPRLEGLFARLGVPPRPPPAPHIARALRILETPPRDGIRLAEVAQVADLSASRFRHAIRELTGLTFRRYRRWRRLAVVIRSLAQGQDLTSAAFSAGFSSSAHLSTSFKATFGLRPSDLIKAGTTYDVDGA
ncbi:MAG: AraC family transcriptional regulator [Myxococcota bacterium]